MKRAHAPVGVNRISGCVGSNEVREEGTESFCVGGRPSQGGGPLVFSGGLCQKASEWEHKMFRGSL